MHRAVALARRQAEACEARRRILYVESRRDKRAVNRAVVGAYSRHCCQSLAESQRILCVDTGSGLLFIIACGVGGRVR